MAGKYEDIMNLPRHRSTRHAPMSVENRAAQFMPFAALTGYEAALSEAERLTEDFQELDEDLKAILDAKLQILEEKAGERPEVTIRYFVPDERKEGGSYREVSGRFRKVDPRQKTVFLESGEGILLEYIVEIRSELLEGME